MSEEFKNVLKVASMYAATIIGAGFASGQEIMRFFSVYNEGGFFGIVFAGFLFAVIGYIVLVKVRKERISNYDELLFPMVGWFIGWIMEIIVTLFMLSLFCIMIAGMGNVLMDKFGIAFNYATLIMAAACMIVILTDIRGVVMLGTLVTPVLIIGITAVGLYIIAYKDTSVFNMVGYFKGITDNWFFSSLIYVSYNSIMSVVVMCGLLPYLKTDRTCKAGGILGGLMLCAIALILNSAIYIFYPGILTNELPVLNIVEKYNYVIGGLYTMVLFLAMLISAVTSGYCFVERIKSKVRFDKRLIAVIICALAVPLSSIGFSGLISKIYPVFGYAGLFMIFAILLQGIKLKSLKVFYKKRGKWM